MQTNRLDSRLFIHCKIIFALLLFVGVSQTIAVKAQKTPEPFKKDAELKEKTQYKKLYDTYFAVSPLGSNPDIEKARLARNLLISETVTQTNKYFDTYWNMRTNGNKLFQTIMDVLEVGAATAIVVTNGARPKTLIGQGLSFVQGSRTAINKDFQLGLLDAVRNRAEANRAELLTKIYQNLNKSDKDFPWATAKSVLIDYWTMGKIESALPSVIATTENQKENAQQRRDDAFLSAGGTLIPTPEQYKASFEITKVKDEIIEDWEATDAKLTTANANIAAADVTIAAEKVAAVPNAANIAIATGKRAAALIEKQTAEATQKKELERMNKIYSMVKLDSELFPFLLDKAYAKYPLLITTIRQGVQHIDGGVGNFRNDYEVVVPLIIFMSVDEMRSNPKLVEKVKNILEASK